jgi:hypothetical protein
MTSQNALLLAAGFAPAFQERSLAELENARTSQTQIRPAVVCRRGRVGVGEDRQPLGAAPDVPRLDRSG